MYLHHRLTLVLQGNINWGLLCQKNVSDTGTSKYISQTVLGVITCPCPWFLLLSHKSSIRVVSPNGNIFRVTGPLWGESTGDRSPVDSPHKGQWRGALMFSLICTSTNGWANNRDAGDLERHHAQYNVTVINCYQLRFNIPCCCPVKLLWASQFSLKDCMSPLRPLREILSWWPILMSSHSNSFGNRARVDFIIKHRVQTILAAEVRHWLTLIDQFIHNRRHMVYVFQCKV